MDWRLNRDWRLHRDWRLLRLGFTQRERASSLQRRRGWPWVLACLVVAVAAWALGVAAEESPKQAGLVNLAGLWAVQVGDGDWGSTTFDDSSWPQVEIPATWEELTGGDTERPLWLRRRVLLPSAWAKELAPSGLALSVGPLRYGAFQVFVGGRLVGQLGDAETRVPTPRNRFFEIPAEAITEQGTLLVALRIDRAAWVRAPNAPAPFDTIDLGDRSVLEARVKLASLRAYHGSIFQQVAVLLFWAVALFALVVDLRQRRWGDHFWLGVFLVLVGLVFLIEIESLRLFEDFDLAQRLQAAAFHASLAVFVQFFWAFLDQPRGLTIRRLQWLHSGIALLSIVLPSYRHLGWLYSVRWLLALVLAIAVLAFLVRALRQGNSEARIAGVGVVTMGIAISTEVVLRVFELGSAMGLQLLGLTVLLGSIIFAWSQRSGRAQTELEQMRLRLERMVEDRTVELSQANRRLEAEVAERQLAEEAMRMLERAVEQSVDGIAVANLHGHMQFINEAWARMHGYEVFELLGYDLSIFHTEEQAKRDLEPAMEKVRKQGFFEGEVAHRRRGGGVFPTWMTATSLRDGNGQEIGYVFIARDITERRKEEEERARLEARVQQAAKLESLGGLAGGIAHDYNNILTGILGHAGLALLELPADSPVRHRIRQVEASAERAAELTDQLLAYAGQEQNQERVMSLNDIIEESRAYFESAIHGAARLEVHLRKDLPAAVLDPDQIRQAIFNLLANAAESLGDEGGTVMLRTSMVNAKRSYFDGALLESGQGAGRYVFFEVSDSGCGMSEETRAKMFDPFFTTKGTGRGLGLAAVLGIVRSHQGAIKVYSQEGRGTTVEVLFAASLPEERMAASRAERAEDSSGAFQGWKPSGVALVVDDEVLVRDIAARVLQKQGFEVLSAASGEQALALHAERRADIKLVLLDLTMPEMDGEHVARELLARAPNLQILLMSGYSEQTVMPGLVNHRLAGFLHKPFRPNELLRKVRHVLELADGRAGQGGLEST